MLDKYEELNDNSRHYFLVLLYNKVKDKEVLKRCKEEIDLLYDKGLLFILEFLHKYKKTEESVSFHFRGMANNLLLLYVFGISKIDPIKYNLPYELFSDESLHIDFINGSSLDFIKVAEKYARNFRIIRCSEENVEQDDSCLEKNFVIIPTDYKPKDLTFKLNDFSEFQTIEKYDTICNQYLTITLDDSVPYFNKPEVNITNAFKSEHEEEIIKIIKPLEFEDYVKIKSMSHGTKVWNNNQDEIFKSNIITIKDIISNREDVYEYLLKHKINKKMAIKITNFIRYGKASKDKHRNEWNNYIKIMKDHNCDNTFIAICSKIEYLFGRGQAISECLFAMDENNYFDEESI